MYFRATVLAVLAASALAGCTTPSANRENASLEAIAAAAYVHDGPPALTLYTMINNRSEAGAHSSLMINAPSQRVIFDPAGSVRAVGLLERDDVLYGVTPRIEQFYERAHARETYRVRIQRVEVSPDVAEKALQLAESYGAVSQSQCTVATSGVLSQLPGFGDINRTWFPNKLADNLAQHPGVTERVVREDDADDKAVAIARFEAQETQ
ncbi:MAG: hypothetical protein HWE37_01130 [Rhodobacteraceae bacterium]|nr:hypothetical protein [Paracoccaceae bacterium]